MTTIKILIFLISSIGMFLYIKRKIKIKEEFIPIIIISFIGVVEFIAGILNIMKLISLMISIIGVILFIKEIIIIKKYKIKLQFNINMVIYIVLLFIAIYILKGMILTGYDDFTHWGVIARETILNNRLPSFKDNIITFITYPPGTTCFIYYVCKFIGYSESHMLFAQSILVISSIYTLFAFCNKGKKINYFICVIAIIYLLIGNIFIIGLGIDTILAVMAIAVLSVIIYYRKDSKKALLSIAPILCLLAIVKNSGILFVIIDILVWLWYFIKNNSIKAIFKTKYIAIILLPIFLLIIWKAHTNLVFVRADTSVHSMSISNYVDHINKKDINLIKDIAISILNKISTLEIKENIIMLLILLIEISLTIIARKNKNIKSRNVKIFIFNNHNIYNISIGFIWNICIFYVSRGS